MVLSGKAQMCVVVRVPQGVKVGKDKKEPSKKVLSTQCACFLCLSLLGSNDDCKNDDRIKSLN